MQSILSFIKKILLLFILLNITMPACTTYAYYQYNFQDEKLYFFDNKKPDNSGIGYLFWGAIFSMNNPVILGILGVAGGIGAIVNERDFQAGSIITGIGGIEIYLQTLSDKTMSQWLNGAIAGAAIFSPLVFIEESYPPKLLLVSPQSFYRYDIRLQYDEAKQIYFDLMDQGYIESTPYQAKLTKKFNPNEIITLSSPLEKFSTHTQWVLTQIYIYNQIGSNPRIIFDKPTSNIIGIMAPSSSMREGASSELEKEVQISVHE